MMYKVSFFSCLILIHQFCLATAQTISSPGFYTLSNNITYSPAGADDIILISSSDVVLDLAQTIITQGNSTAGVNGIEISSGVSNVTIKNGIIQSVTGAGILVGSGCSNITIANVLTYACATRGIDFNGGASSPITDSAILNFSINSCCQGASADYALHIQNCSRLQVSNGTINKNGTTGTNLSCVRLDGCANSRFENIQVNSNSAGSIKRSFDIQSNTSLCIFRNCLSVNNQSTAASADHVGFFLSTAGNNSSNFFINCIVMGNSATASGATFKGFYVTPFVNDRNILIDCKVLNNSSSGQLDCYYISANNVVLINCIANNNSSSASNITGAECGGTVRATFINCAMLNLNGSSGSCYGYDFNTLSQNNVLANNVAINIVSPSVGTGFNNTNSTTNVFSSNISALNLGSNFNNSHGYNLSGDTSSAYIKNIALRNSTRASHQYEGFGASQSNVQNISSVNSITQPWTNAGLV